MRKLLLVLSLCFTGAAWAATTQPQSLGVVTVLIETKTKAEMNALAPKGTGQLLFISDGGTSRLCISSGTAAGAWVVAAATGSFTASLYPHCQ